MMSCAFEVAISPRAAATANRTFGDFVGNEVRLEMVLAVLMTCDYQLWNFVSTLFGNIGKVGLRNLVMPDICFQMQGKRRQLAR